MEENNNVNGEENVATEAKPTVATNGDNNEKMAAILAYIAFFLPMLMAKDSKFAMYHANQGLLWLIAVVALSTVDAILYSTFVLAPVAMLLGTIGGIFLFVLFVMGIINANNGEMKPLPVIGNMATLIK